MPDPDQIKTAAELFPELRPALTPVPVFTWRDDFDDAADADLADGELLHYLTREGAMPHATTIVVGGDFPRLPSAVPDPNRVTCPTCRAYIARETARLADLREPRGGWPCDRRDAHHGHIAYAQPEDRCYPYECEGVGAHPSTMIGRP